MRYLKMREGYKQQKGLSLIELMIAIVIGLIVTAGVLQLFVSTLIGNRDLLSQARLETELTSIVHFMANDIRRAGYWGDEGKNVDWGSSDRNPFIEAIPGVEAIAINETTGETPNSCILYAYNLDGAAEVADAKVGFCASCALPAGVFSGADFDNDNLEMFGYRLNTGVIEMRTGPVDSSGTVASTYTCNDGGWEALSDSDVVNIDTLSFSLAETLIDTVTTESGTDLDIQSIEVSIEVEGSLVSDSAVTKKVKTKVRLANTRVSE